MTDRGTRVRWTTAALVAPAAAAVFTGTTVWAAEHEPATASTTTATTTATTPAAAAPVAAAPAQPDPVIASLRAAIDANTVQVERLRTTVATLQAEAASIAQGTPGAAVRTSTASTRATSRTSTTSGRSTTTRTSAPAPKPAPVAAPAPDAPVVVCVAGAVK